MRRGVLTTPILLQCGGSASASTPRETRLPFTGADRNYNECARSAAVILPLLFPRKTRRVQHRVHEQWQRAAPEEPEVRLVGKGDHLPAAVGLADQVRGALQPIDRFVPGNAGDERLVL